jgi:hypothetical protein
MEIPNGILARVRGEDISAGNKQLPDPVHATVGSAIAEVNGLHRGPIQIVYHRRVQRSGRNRFPYWVAVRAWEVDRLAPERL